jgi:hypothetical protein
MGGIVEIRCHGVGLISSSKAVQSADLARGGNGGPLHRGDWAAQMVPQVLYELVDTADRGVQICLRNVAL